MSVDTRQPFSTQQANSNDLLGRLELLINEAVPGNEFWPAALSLLTIHFSCSGGAIWRKEGSRLHSLAEEDLPSELRNSSGATAPEHVAGLSEVMASGSPIIVPPNSPGQVINPTSMAMLAAPFGEAANASHVVVVVFENIGQAQSSLLVLLPFCRVLSQYAAVLAREQSIAEARTEGEIERFTQRVHASLDCRLTSHVTVNEVRRLLECDRVSLALRRGSAYRLEAISGQAVIERRSNVARGLSAVASAAAPMNAIVWSDDDLPPEIAGPMNGHIETCLVKSIVVLPLNRPSNERHEIQEEGQSDEPETGELVGVLVLEQMEDMLPREALSRRLPTIQRHAATAIANARDHSDLFLMPVWRLLGKATSLFKGGWLPLTLTVLIGVLVASVALIAVPTDFTLEANGSLEPVEKQDFFAPVDGVVDQLHVTSGEIVAAQTPIIAIRSSELDLEYHKLLGAQQTNWEELRSTERLALETANVEPAERVKLSAELSRLKVEANNLALEMELLNDRRRQLQISSTHRGQVVTWNLEEKLRDRPVRRGQLLVTVAQPEGGWRLELLMPERRMGHLMRAWNALGDEERLPVTYVLATDPGVRRHGELVSVEPITELNETEGPVVRLVVQPDPADVELFQRVPRPGAAIIAHVKVGRASLGYAWLHEGWEWAQRNIFF